MYEPGYYVTDKTYFLETNLYNAATDRLILVGTVGDGKPGKYRCFCSRISRGFIRTDGQGWPICAPWGSGLVAATSIKWNG